MDNLQAQYDEVTAYLDGYRKFISGFDTRLARLIVTSFREYSQLNAKFWKTSFRFDPLSEKTQDTLKNVLLVLATDEERRNRYFTVATSDYPTDALGDDLKKQFPGFSFEKIKKVHESKQTQLARFSLGQFLGVIMATSTLLLKSIPKAVVESWGVDYTRFEIVVFWLTVGFAAYLLLCLLPIWVKYHRARNRSRRVGEILEYVVIKNG